MSALGVMAAFGSGFIKEMAGCHWLANLATLAAILMMLAAYDMSRRTTSAVTPV